MLFKGKKKEKKFVRVFSTSFIIVTILFFGINAKITYGNPSNRDYRQDMRDFVQSISAFVKGFNSNFFVIPQNGHDLITTDGEKTGAPSTSYLNAIDGIGREDLFYGYNEDNVVTSETLRDNMIALLDIAETHDVQILVTDYCSTHTFVDNSYSQNTAKGYISFAADHRELDNIPLYPTDPYNVNSQNITSLAQAKNFLYLLDPSLFSDKVSFLDSLKATNYDVIIMDLFYDNTELSSSEVLSLKTKKNGGTRAIISYMSIGEVEDYRYYWKSDWKTNSPAWLAEENPNWAGNYKVRYWESNWQNIIYGNDTSYTKKIIDARFDGVYLDIIDAFEYFEDNNGFSDDNGNNDKSSPGFSLHLFFVFLVVGVIVRRKSKR
ncbi:MAG: endo alpha-1,4 polygalactosaminidase [Candidatus Hodarchaeales archaeon]|jgi:cysteinyl-tRNA synthetase